MNLQKTVDALIKHAMDIGEGYNKVFDFSDESVRSVSEILDYYHEMYHDVDNNIIKEQPNTFAHIWGVYVGEVLKRNYAPNWTWERGEYGLVLAKNESNMVNPVGKAYKHITNGGDDGIAGFFTVAIAIMQNKFPSQNITDD